MVLLHFTTPSTISDTPEFQLSTTFLVLTPANTATVTQSNTTTMAMFLVQPWRSAIRHMRFVGAYAHAFRNSEKAKRMPTTSANAYTMASTS